MDELIAKLEQATGPDKNLEEEIERILARGIFDPEFEGHPRPGSQLWPRYTASLDAALTLVPEKWDWLISKGDDEPASVSLAPSRAIAAVHGTHEIPALALCIAALRARAHTPREQAEPK